MRQTVVYSFYNRFYTKAADLPAIRGERTKHEIHRKDQEVLRHPAGTGRDRAPDDRSDQGDVMEEYRSRVYTDRPPYADFAPPQKFQAIQGIIARRLREHPKAICSYSGGSDSDILIDLIERTRPDREDQKSAQSADSEVCVLQHRA